MKTPKFTLNALLIVSIFALPVFAQNTANTSLADLQSSLKKMMEKNSHYVLNRLESRILDVEFDGCKMSYVTKSNTTADPGFPDPGWKAPEGTLPNYHGNSRYASFRRFTFDLQDIDLGAVSVKNLNDKRDDISSIGFKIIEEKPLITIEFGQKYYPPSAARNNPSMFKNSYYWTGNNTRYFINHFSVKSKIAEKVKTDLAEAVKLCQVEK